MMKVKNWSAWKRSAAAWRMTEGSGGGVGEGVSTAAPPVPQAAPIRTQVRAAIARSRRVERSVVLFMILDCFLGGVLMPC